MSFPHRPSHDLSGSFANSNICNGDSSRPASGGYAAPRSNDLWSRFSSDRPYENSTPGCYGSPARQSATSSRTLGRSQSPSGDRIQHHIQQPVQRRFRDPQTTPAESESRRPSLNQREEIMPQSSHSDRQRFGASNPSAYDPSQQSVRRRFPGPPNNPQPPPIQPPRRRFLYSPAMHPITPSPSQRPTLDATHHSSPQQAQSANPQGASRWPACEQSIGSHQDHISRTRLDNLLGRMSAIETRLAGVAAVDEDILSSIQDIETTMNTFRNEGRHHQWAHVLDGLQQRVSTAKEAATQKLRRSDMDDRENLRGMMGTLYDELRRSHHDAEIGHQMMGYNYSETLQVSHLARRLSRDLKAALPSPATQEQSDMMEIQWPEAE